MDRSCFATTWRTFWVIMGCMAVAAVALWRIS